MKRPRLLLTRVRDRIRSKHFSFQTEKTYLQWIRRFVEFNDFRAPEELTRRDVERCLTMLAVERKVSAATQNQALAAILILCKHVLNVVLPWLGFVTAPPGPERGFIIVRDGKGPLD